VDSGRRLGASGGARGCGLGEMGAEAEVKERDGTRRDGRVWEAFVAAKALSDAGVGR
jgi:hypothetical protein